MTIAKFFYFFNPCRYLYYSAPENLPKLFGVMCAIFWGGVWGGAPSPSLAQKWPFSSNLPRISHVHNAELTHISRKAATFSLIVA